MDYFKRKVFPFYPQHDSMDCGPACLRMVAAFHGRDYSLDDLRRRSYIDKEGVSLKGISEAAESIGYRTLGVKIPFSAKHDLPSLKVAPLPVIVHWNQNHFVSLYKLTNKHAFIADPGSGKHKLSQDEFKKHWISDHDRGIALLLEPTADFVDNENGRGKSVSSFQFFKSYVKPHRRLIVQLILGLILASVFQLIFPFLTQSIVDVGIDNQDINFIYLILVGQLMIFGGQLSVRVIQSWILLHVSTRININLISDYLQKLMKLPLGFFDSRNTGDLLQRIGDHRRIENFLTQSSLSILISAFNILIFGLVLFIYSVNIFLIFLISSVIYISWITFFLKRRRVIDYLAFQQMSDNQSSLIEIIQGMPEIKLQGSHFKRRWAWASIQARLFRIQMKSLAIAQYQDIGGMSINQLKDIFITFLAAKAVISGQMTLGMMLAVQYIIGQLNAPLQQLINFIRAAQDARISYDRLSEIHSQDDEQSPDVIRLKHIPEGDIELHDVSFSYTPISNQVLENVNLNIPHGKITAIVGSSGSGKTTLIKLLLGFYPPSKGYIKIGHTLLEAIDKTVWRANCGVVMQEGYLFSDTMAENIAESDDHIDLEKMLKASEAAHIREFIESMPLSYNTMIGAKGNGISQGQRQRMLIARAVYKNPEFIFLDEATNALDAVNEGIIIRNLNHFFKGRTVVIVAHRLSTVKHADQIIVMEAGKIIETGNHADLVARRGNYFDLVSNQLELAEA